MIHNVHVYLADVEYLILLLGICIGRSCFSQPGVGEQAVLPGREGEPAWQVHQDCGDQRRRQEEPDPHDLLDGGPVQPEPVELYRLLS